MLIRCKYCGNVVDLRSRIVVDMYLNGIPARCKRCLGDIYYEEEEDGIGDMDIKSKDKI